MEKKDDKERSFKINIIEFSKEENDEIKSKNYNSINISWNKK